MFAYLFSQTFTITNASSANVSPFIGQFGILENANVGFGMLSVIRNVNHRWKSECRLVYIEF